MRLLLLHVAVILGFEVSRDQVRGCMLADAGVPEPLDFAAPWNIFFPAGGSL